MNGIPVSGGMSAPGSWTIIGVLYATSGVSYDGCFHDEDFFTVRRRT
jgi:hypothetical protein